MKRRAFLSTLTLSATLWVAQASAQPLLYNEGVDYTVLPTPLPLQKAGQNEVIEFFSYACPHCAGIEPHIIKWSETKKPADVGLYQLPALGGDMWTFTGRAKFTAQKLGLSHTFDQQYFTAIHKDGKRRLLGDKDYTFDFIAKAAKVDVSEVEKAWNSLQVKSNMVKSNQLAQQAKINAVPAIIVNGKYLVKINSYDFSSVVDYLLAKHPVAPVKSEVAAENSADKVAEKPAETTEPAEKAAPKREEKPQNQPEEKTEKTAAPTKQPEKTEATPASEATKGKTQVLTPEEVEKMLVPATPADNTAKTN